MDGPPWGNAADRTTSVPVRQARFTTCERAPRHFRAILVLDEPTSSLTAGETVTLLSNHQRSAQSGREHHLHLPSAGVNLGGGRPRGRPSATAAMPVNCPRGQIGHEAMVRLMIGRDLRNFFVSGSGTRRPARLQWKKACTQFWPARSVSFDAAGAEILGFAGLVGAGRSELAESIFGVRPLIGGEVWLDGHRLTIRHCRDAIAAGICLVPRIGVEPDWSPP